MAAEQQQNADLLDGAAQHHLQIGSAGRAALRRPQAPRPGGAEGIAHQLHAHAIQIRDDH